MSRSQYHHARSIASPPSSPHLPQSHCRLLLRRRRYHRRGNVSILESNTLIQLSMIKSFCENVRVYQGIDGVGFSHDPVICSEDSSRQSTIGARSKAAKQPSNPTTKAVNRLLYPLLLLSGHEKGTARQSLRGVVMSLPEAKDPVWTHTILCRK